MADRSTGVQQGREQEGVEALAEARGFAAAIHMGQQDRLGVPYIDHCTRVMMAVPGPARRVAVLHDALEDSTHTKVEIVRAARLTATEGEALRLLTRARAGFDTPRFTYADYVQAIADAPGEAGRIARAVKRADLLDNLSPDRADGLTPSLRERYEVALEALGPEPKVEADNPSVASVLRRTASRLRDPEHRWSVDPAVTLERLAEKLERSGDGRLSG